MRISDWSSDVCSSDLRGAVARNIISTFKRERAREEGPHCPAAPPVATFVERDARDPDAERPRAIVTPQRREAGDEAFLRQIHRLALVADIAADQAKNGGLVARQKLAIRVLPAAKRERREIAVAIVRQAVRHLASAVSALTTTRSEEHTSELQSLMRISY